jgi:hypothetical protein
MAKIITATVYIEVKDSVAYECFETAKNIGRALFDNYTDLEFLTVYCQDNDKYNYVCYNFERRIKQCLN